MSFRCALGAWADNPGYRVAMFRAGRERWRAVAVVGIVAIGCVSSLTLLACPLNAAAGSTNSSSSAVTPSDGRLRGQDFAASVTSVAWPAQATVAGRSVEAPPGHRFVVFALSLSENSASITPAGTPPVSAEVIWGTSSTPLSLTAIENQILAAGSGNGWPSGTGQFTVAVPNTTHAVDLVVSEGSFSQSFDLWTLRRTPPTPAVLYRDPSTPTLSGTGGAPATLVLSNPSDGFSSSASVTLQSAALGYFPPSGAASAPLSPDQAVLSVVLDAEFPNNPNDPTGSGHYLGSQAPLPASLVTFTPSGGAAVSATESGAGVNTGKGNNDDGLFDATYSFVVPATLSTGTISVGTGSFSGAEFTLYTAEQGSTTLDVTSPMTLPISFPTVPAEATQKTPPWVGQPLPPTADPGSGSGSSGSGTRSGGFPIWLAVLAVAILAGGVVIVQKRRHRTPTPATSGSAPAVAADSSFAATVAADRPPLRGSEPAPQGVPEAPEEATTLAINVLGPRQIVGPLHKPMRRIVEELLVYLVLHKRRHLRVGQILLGMWPTGSTREEVTEKTLRNYLYELRGAIGPEHLPDASGTDGYLIEGVATDWERFERLEREADAIGGAPAVELRTEALTLVRGQPFEDLPEGAYDWVSEERLDTHMIVAIAACARALATDRFEAKEFVAAHEAAASGLRGARHESDLWLIGARALAAREDRTALGHWMADASRYLDAAEIARIEALLRPDHDPDQS